MREDKTSGATNRELLQRQGMHIDSSSFSRRQQNSCLATSRRKPRRTNVRTRCRTIFQAVVINRRVTEFLLVKKIRERQRVKPAAASARQSAHMSLPQTWVAVQFTRRCRIMQFAPEKSLVSATRVPPPSSRSKPFNAAPRCRHPAHGLLRHLYRNLQLFFSKRHEFLSSPES